MYEYIAYDWGNALQKCGKHLLFMAGFDSHPQANTFGIGCLGASSNSERWELHYLFMYA